jgi:hypothetical protein
MSFSSWLRNRKSIQSKWRDGLQIRPTAAAFRPRLEALEDRWVPSTLKVTNTLDSGAGSLRYEIAQAQSNDTIVFEFGNKKRPHTITLSSGELDINKNLTIQGPGAGLLTVASTGLASTGSLNYGSSRIFEVESYVTNATLSGMTISNGVGFKSSYNNPYSSSDYYDGAGGGVLNLGTLTISSCTLSNNFAHVYGTLFGTGGGGVANFGTLTMSGCTLSNNRTFGNGGAIDNGINPIGYVRGTLTISGCTLSGNSGLNGGGIYNDVGCTLNASGCTVSGNTAKGDGSGANTGLAIDYGYGGGIFNNGGTVAVSNCTLSGNSAYSGGGIYNGGPLTVSNSMFSSNTPDNIYGSYSDGGGNTFN